LVDPRDAEVDDPRRGPGRWNALEKAQGARATRHREPVVPPTKRMPTTLKSGGTKREEVPLTREEYDKRLADIETANAAREAARLEYDAAAADAPTLRLPDMDRTPPAKFQDTDAEVRLYAWQTTGRLRPKSTPVQIEAVCEFCAPAPCDCEQDDDEADSGADWDSSPTDAYDLADDALERARLLRPDLYDSVEDDDRAQWQIDHADAIAEGDAELLSLELEEVERREAARLQQERDLEPWLKWVESDPAYQYHPYRGVFGRGVLASPGVVDVAGQPHLARAVWTAKQMRTVYAVLGVDAPPAAPFDGIVPDIPEGAMCVHCGMDPIQTKKDGLCRSCKSYKTGHRGELPPPAWIEKKRRRKYG